MQKQNTSWYRLHACLSIELNFDPEDGGDISSEMSVGFQRTKQRYIHYIINIHLYFHRCLLPPGILTKAL
jgi:hypothetical protein